MLEARTPPVRASSIDSCQEDPFGYYLRERLGITNPLFWSEALSRGSWAHKAQEHLWLSPSSRREKVAESLGSRMDEITTISSQVGIKEEYVAERLELERQDMECALGWFEAWSQTPISLEHGTLLDFLSRPYWVDLGPEILLVLNESSTLAACRFDRLLYHKTNNELWILDLKTTDTYPDVRAQICPIESATFLYTHLLARTLAVLTPARVSALLGFDLPHDVRIGGMIHLICQKPSIEFCSEDRPYKEYDHVLKSGPRKGQIEIRKEFTSDTPVHALYVDRCSHWLAGTREYTDKAAERSAHPCVNLSFSSHTSIQSAWPSKFQSRYDQIRHYSTCPDDPIFFPMNPSSLLAFGKLSPYAPFYLTPQSGWEEIMLRNNLIQRFRDPEISSSSATTLVPQPQGTTA